MTSAQLLAEPVRAYIVELLCSGAMTSGDLATMCFDAYRVGWSSVSRHINALEAAGWARRIRERTERWIALEPYWLALARADVDRFEALWQAGARDRAIGLAGSLYDTTGNRWDTRRDPDDVPSGPEVRGRRGRSTADRAAFGVGRSHDSDGADGGGGFE